LHNAHTNKKDPRVNRAGPFASNEDKLSPALALAEIGNDRNFHDFAVVSLDAQINCIEPHQDTDAEARGNNSDNAQDESLSVVRLKEGAVFLVFHHHNNDGNQRGENVSKHGPQFIVAGNFLVKISHGLAS
jgi:hypothetical protein